MPISNRPGRPRKAELYGQHIRAAEDKIADGLPEYVDNLVRLARGVWMEETTKDGKRRVYQEPPDRASNEYLINRIMGKPTEIQEISGPDGGPVRYVDRANNPRDTNLTDLIGANGNGDGNGVAS